LLSEFKKSLKDLGCPNRSTAEMEDIFLDSTNKLIRLTDAYSKGRWGYEASSLPPSHAIYLRSRIAEQSELFYNRIMNEGHLWCS
jgi:hypothetical protein